MGEGEGGREREREGEKGGRKTEISTEPVAHKEAKYCCVRSASIAALKKKKKKGGRRFVLIL